METTDTATDITTTCGCALEPAPCTLHRFGDHRHCTTCGVAVFIDEVYEDGHVEYDDHHCPPGFLLTPATPTEPFTLERNDGTITVTCNGCSEKNTQPDKGLGRANTAAWKTRHQH